MLSTYFCLNTYLKENFKRVTEEVFKKGTQKAWEHSKEYAKDLTLISKFDPDSYTPQGKPLGFQIWKEVKY